MIPILLCSIIGVYLIIERLIYVRSVSKVPDTWIETVLKKTEEADFKAIGDLCDFQKCALARVIKAGVDKIVILNGEVDSTIENAGQVEVRKLEKNVSILATIASTAPMLGFLGTVTGMIQAFMAISNEANSVSPKLIANGIYEAMITTAAGLIVGIFVNLCYSYILMKIEESTRVIELNANRFLTLVRAIPKHKLTKTPL